MVLTFEPYEGTLDQWGAILEGLPEREVFQTPAWLRFVATTQHATPVIARLTERGAAVGWFAGLVVRKFGLRILGSPFPGWSTPYMGLLLGEEVSRQEALEALVCFAFEELGCVHLTLSGRNLRHEDAEGLPFEHRDFNGFEMDLTESEEALLAHMRSSCRWSIRKARREGVVIKEAQDAQFAEDYYLQLQDVFAKQRLLPPFGIDRVRTLIGHLLPTGNLLLLRARAPDGRCVATGIFPAWNRTMYFWGSASWRHSQWFQPNELLLWEAVRYWKARGMRCLDLIGSGEYKLKYGAYRISVPVLSISKYPWLGHAKRTAARLLKFKRQWLGRWRARQGTPRRSSAPG